MTITQIDTANWTTTKAKIKAKWSKFSDLDIDGFQKSLDGIVAQLQKSYGLTKELAETQYGEFKTSLKASSASDTPKPKLVEMSAPSAMKKN